MAIPILTAPPATVAAEPIGWLQRQRMRRRERVRLADEDRRAAHRAELVLLRSLLAEASDLVDSGWVQHCWWVVRDDVGRVLGIGSRNLHELDSRPIAQSCLVGAIVAAAGGIDRAGSQPVHRALDLTWATLHNQPVRWCPSPQTRLSHVHDLTRWNDAPGRTAHDVSGLLALASDRADRAH